LIVLLAWAEAGQAGIKKVAATKSKVLVAAT
jgi:hypothetical protein